MKRRRIYRAAVTVMIGAWLLCCSTAAARIVVPSYALKIAGARETSGYSWGVWLFGAQHGKGCWATRSGRGNIKSEGVTCGLSVPMRPWQLVTDGIVGGGSVRHRVLAMLTRTSAHRVDVLTEKSGGRQRHWVAVSVKVISEGTARNAKLPYPLGYAVLVLPETTCGSSVRVVGSHRRIIGRGRVPCSAPLSS
jgi:hypothetical protein